MNDQGWIASCGSSRVEALIREVVEFLQWVSCHNLRIVAIPELDAALVECRRTSAIFASRFEHIHSAVCAVMP